MQAPPLTQSIQPNAAREECGMHYGKHIATGEHLTASCQIGKPIWKADSDVSYGACRQTRPSKVSNGPGRLIETINRADSGARG